MIRKLLPFLYISFIFIFCAVKADVVHEPIIIKINSISLYQTAADRIIKDAKNKNIRITYEDDENLTINGSELLDEVIRLYKEAISEKGDKKHTWKESEKMMVYVNKKKDLIDTVLIHEGEEDDEL